MFNSPVFTSVYGNKADMFVWPNDYLKNSQPQVPGESEFHAYKGARQMCIHAKIILNPK